MVHSWSDYLKASIDNPLHPIWEHIDPYLKPGQVALDLGCGAGGGVLHMLEMRLQVIGVDEEPEALDITRKRLPAGARAHLVQARFQELGLDAESLDVVIALFSLFFLQPWEFGEVWQKLLRSLRPGGIWAGQLLGIHDDWAVRGYTVHTRAEAESLLHPFEILYFEEAERDGETLLREPKHWHVFHVVGRMLG
ncbi:MAG: class I SAM-dependent methyltransferase [Fimbriimonadales bacterium]